MIEEKVAVLMERAVVEEKAYNWVEAGKLYEMIAQLFLNEDMVKNAAEVYKKLGNIHFLGSMGAQTAEEYLKLSKYAIKAFIKSATFFKQMRNRSEELECDALSFFCTANIANSFVEAKKKMNQSCEISIKSNENYSKENDREGLARTFQLIAITSLYSTDFASNLEETEYFIRRGRSAAIKSWMLSKEVKNIESLAWSLYAERTLNIIESAVKYTMRDDYWKDKQRKFLLKCNESIMFSESVNDFFSLGVIDWVAGCTYSEFALNSILNERKQWQYLDKGIKLLEKSLSLGRKVRNNWLIIVSITMLHLYAIQGFRYKYVQNRIFNDVREVLELGKIYKGVFQHLNFITNLFPANYYNNMAMRDFFTSDLRKVYAEKAIEYANECLKIPSNPYNSSPVFLILTSSYSQLTVLSIKKELRDEYAQKMLYYAQQARKIGEEYGSGVSRSLGYTSLYVAYKTLADITEDKKYRAELLKTTISALKESMKYSLESRMGLFSTQMRLGGLYEELSIITGENNPLMRAEDIFLRVIKESIEGGAHYYAASAFEYIARIEDRLGNHNASVENYKNAEEAHLETLNGLEYQPLKNRVKEKIKYVRAWILIEKAKLYHKKENHLKAKESYEKASEILKKVSIYNYESHYYFAWALMEEAEQLSKHERQEESIEKYELTRINFNVAIKILNKASKRYKEKGEKERIEKLKKVAKILINYCSARINLEKARIYRNKGEHLEAVENLAVAASQFKLICSAFKIERERKEFEAIYYLCRAWESMALAEEYEEPEKFAEAANLFIKASDIFTDNKLKVQFSGNSAFCQALELGCKFDESKDTQIKTQLYSKVKLMLRRAASSYAKGDFESDAEWALATSTYFDATWNLIRVNVELNLEEKRKFLRIGLGFLKSAANLFGNAGFKDKELEIQNRLIMVEKEKKILVSALNTIKAPSISRSTTGIIAPTCPIETGRSPRIDELKQITEESRRVLATRPSIKKTKSKM